MSKRVSADQDAKFKATLRELMKKPENRSCADCGAKGERAASLGARRVAAATATCAVGRCPP